MASMRRFNGKDEKALAQAGSIFDEEVDAPG
jgi:hypothetical protein